MNQEERLMRIFDYLEINKTMNIKQMCEMFNVSRDTARRDIVKLSQHKEIIRIYGGISLSSYHKKLGAYQERIHMESEAKQSIGTAAAGLVNDNDMIFLDSSTTVSVVAQYLKAKNITVVTNSIDIAYTLAQSKDINVHLLGGSLNKVSRHISGYSTIEQIKNFFFDKVFIGAGGIMPDGIYYVYEEDIYFKRELIKYANQVILVADHTKYNQRQSYKVLNYQSIDTFITNQIIPKELLDQLDENGVEVISITKG